VDLLIDDLSVIAKEAIEQAGTEAARAAALASIEREAELLREKAAALREMERWKQEAGTAQSNGMKNVFMGVMAGLLGGLAIGISGTVFISGHTAY
jgi:hypothetical protein